MKSNYGNRIYEIVKVKNNSVIIKDDKDDLYRVRKNEIKSDVKPDKLIDLEAKTNASIDRRQD